MDFEIPGCSIEGSRRLRELFSKKDTQSRQAEQARVRAELQDAARRKPTPLLLFTLGYLYFLENHLNRGLNVLRNLTTSIAKKLRERVLKIRERIEDAETSFQEIRYDETLRLLYEALGMAKEFAAIQNSIRHKILRVYNERGHRPQENEMILELYDRILLYNENSDIFRDRINLYIRSNEYELAIKNLEELEEKLSSSDIHTSVSPNENFLSKISVVLRKVRKWSTTRITLSKRHYDILHLPKTAKTEEIISKSEELLKKYELRPNEDDEYTLTRSKLQVDRINESVRILSNPRLRQQHDEDIKKEEEFIRQDPDGIFLQLTTPEMDLYAFPTTNGDRKTLWSNNDENDVFTFTFPEDKKSSTSSSPTTRTPVDYVYFDSKPDDRFPKEVYEKFTWEEKQVGGVKRKEPSSSSKKNVIINHNEWSKEDQKKPITPSFQQILIEMSSVYDKLKQKVNEIESAGTNTKKIESIKQKTADLMSENQKLRTVLLGLEKVKKRNKELLNRIQKKQTEYDDSKKVLESMKKEDYTLILIEGLEEEKLEIMEDSEELEKMRNRNKEKYEQVLKKCEEANEKLSEREVLLFRANLCSVCYENPSDHILTNCGHCFCDGCISKLQGKCPLCRKYITSKMKLSLYEKSK